MNENIRNFAIISHIDHGKSTLADRMLEITGAVESRKMRDRFLDRLDLEQEHGVTIKMQAVRMEHQLAGEDYVLNLIDTPGHVDFGYEVSRALAACEGAILLVDASQGVQAQTLSTAQKAIDQDLKLIPVINKIDLKSANVERVEDQFQEMFSVDAEDILYTSAKTGEGVGDLLEEIIKRVPPPSGSESEKLKALVFDSIYHPHQGVLAYVRVMDGVLPAEEKVLFMKSGVSGTPLDIGFIKGDYKSSSQLSAGEVGFIATGFKDIEKIRVGDTVTLAKKSAEKALSGYKKIKPMVYASLFPTSSDDFERFRKAFEKLALNDASLQFSLENSPALGFGFRVGFLGTFHASIVRERLEREFDLDLVITSPNVRYKIVLTSGEEKTITSPTELPEPTKIEEIKEPWVFATILAPPKYVSQLTRLISKYRGEILEVGNLRSQITVDCELPLGEIITNFHDDLKSLTSGYASFDYKIKDYRAVDLVKLSILVNKEEVEPFARLVVRGKAEDIGRRMVESLKEILPRQQFAVPLQAAVGSNVIARETIPAMRKDVTAKLYGGDRTRKDKLLKKQAEGKKRLRKHGSVDIPKEAYFKVLQS